MKLKCIYNIEIIKQWEGCLYALFKIEQHMLNNYLYKQRYVPKTLIGGDRECFKEKHTTISTILDQIQAAYNSE